MKKQNKISKTAFKAALHDLRVELLNTQFDLCSENFSVLLLIAGNDRKSVNGLLNRLHEWMDARYLHTRVFLPPANEELKYPAYRRYWRELPPAGRIGIFLGAWPLRALAERLLENGTDIKFKQRVDHMNALERLLSSNGTLVLKFWLHVSKREVKKRQKEARLNNSTDASQHDWHIYQKYDEIQPVVENLLTQTTTDIAPWNIVEAVDERYRDLTVARQVLQAIRNRMQVNPQDAPAPAKKHASKTGAVPLAEVDLSASLPRQEYRDRLETLQQELGQLMTEARKKFSTVLVFEGWDAAGKGGVIRRLTRAMFAADYRVFPVAAPDEVEQKHHYLWRFWRNIPRDGQMAIFDRSWYGRVLVERVEGLATPNEWQRAFSEINDFEQQLCEHGCVVCKFWLHIDKNEQARRFKAREQTAYKKYKITEEDYRNREKWDIYTGAVNDMITLTHKDEAPWNTIAANDKKWARVQVLQTVVHSLRQRLEK